MQIAFITLGEFISHIILGILCQVVFSLRALSPHQNMLFGRANFKQFPQEQTLICAYLPKQV